MKKILFLLVALVIAGVSYAQLTGTKTIPGDYASITDAVADLNTQGVGSGGVTFDVAAGYTESITSPILLTATGTSGDPIIFQKSGAGANPLVTRTDAGSNGTSTLGGQGDAVIIIQGSDYVTFNGIDVATSDAGIEYGYYLRKASTTDGCKYVTIKNAVIDLTKGTSAYVAGIYVSNNDASSSVSSATGITVASTGGRNENVTITGNTIQDVFAGIVLRGYNHTTSPYDYYDQNAVVGASGAGNTIRNYAGNSASSSYGVYMIYQTSPNVSYNTIDNAGGGGTDATSTLYGIFMSSSSAGGVFVANNNNIKLGISATSGAHCIYNAQLCTSITINNNTFGYGTFASTTTSYFIYCSNSTNNITIDGNATSGTINKTGAGQLEGYYNYGSPTGGTVTINNNNFSNITLTGASTFYGIRHYTSTSQVMLITNNTISNITGGTSALYGIYQGYGATGNVVSGNNVFGITSSTGSIYGLYVGASSASTSLAVNNNNVYNLSSTGASTIYGIYSYLGTANIVFKNKIYNLTGANASSIIYGINVAGGTLTNVYNNYISDLKATAATGTIAIAGIYISGGTTVGAQYNTIFLNASSSSATTFGTSGIYASTTPTVDLRNNIVVNISTPGPTGGLTVAYRRSSTTLTSYASTSNNNCFYAGTPAANYLIYTDGTNSDQTMAAYKTRVTPRDSYSFSESAPFVNVASTPYDLHLLTNVATQCESGGTPITSPIAITDDYDGNTRNATTPDVGADEGGFTPLDLVPPSIVYTPLGFTGSLIARTLNVTVTDPSGVPTISPGWPNLYWKINYTGTYAAATPTGVAGSVYTYSFGSGVTVGDTVYYYVVAQDNASTPNVGAYPSAGAGNFTINPPAAGTPPTSPSKYVIVGVPLSGDYTVGTAKFNQITGRNIYFEQVIQKVMKEVNVNGPSATVPEKDKETDNVAALDINQGPKELREVEEIRWVPMENGVPYNGDLYIKANEHPEISFPDGTKGVYATITAAVNDLNVRGVSGPVRFLLTDPTYSTGETFPIVVNIVSEALPTATNTVTIRPNTGVTSVITGSGNPSIFYLYGTDYFIFDGSNASGNDKNLTIENTYTTAISAVVILANNGTGATNNTVKNCIIKGSSKTVTNAYGLFLNAAGGFYDNTTIQNNTILNCYYGMQFVGVSGGLTTGGSVTGNTFGSLTDAESIGYMGIQLGYVDGVTVSNNLIQNLKVGTTPYGIYMGTGVVNTKINANKITDIAYTGTSGYGARGIYISTGNAASNLTFSNNMISKIGGDGYSSFSNASPVGMYFDGTTGGLKIYHNSVNMSGTLTYNAATVSAAILFFTSTITNIDLRDNIFVNSLNNTANTGAKNYAIYSTAPVASFANINYNDYFVSGTQGILGYLGGDKVDLAAWQTATAQDVNSVSVDPKFQSTTDLHIITSYPNVNNIGQYLAAVPTDFDGDIRSLTTPDLGADEYTYLVPTVDPPVAFSAAPASSTQIDLTFTPNAVPNNVVIVWNLTGTFTDPTGTPVLNGSLAGGTVLSIGTASPVSHQNLTVSTHYYYKAFSYDGTNYSSGLTADATTLTPVLTVAPTSLAFGFVPYGSTSTEKTYALSGTNLAGTGNITVAAPTAFEVSLTTGTGFGPSVLVPYTGPTLAATTIYVRFVPAAAGTAYTGNITNDGGSAAVKNVAVTGSSDLFASYCASGATNTADEEIFSVTVNGATNAYNCTTVAPGPGSILNRYSNFYPLGSLTTMQQGQTVSFTVLEDECDGATYYSNGCAMWIDFNQDGDFLDAGEQVYTETGTTISPRTITGSFLVPAGAVLGQTALRVTVAEGLFGSGITPCLSYGYGETEDYIVTISAATTPALGATPNTLTFGYTPVGGTSSPQSYVLTGLSLSPSSGNIVVTAPSMFQVSLTSGSGYAGSINVPYTDGAVNATVYAVFAPTAAGTYSDNITNNGGGASAPVAVSGTTNIVYCSAGSTYCDEYISRVQLNTIDNSSSCSSGGYANYSAISTQLTKGSSYTATITNGVPYSGDQCGVWIDWNNNGSFYDAGEAMTVTGGTTVYTATIAPPAGALETSVRMRIRICYTSGLDPCGTATYGEVEDYTITVMPALAHDVGIVSIDNMTSLVTAGTVVTPKATVANFGTNTETFTVTMTSTPGTYTSTQTVTALAPGATVQLTFANWTAEAGSFVFEATAELESDLNNDNNKKSFAIDVFEAGNGTWGTGSAILTGAYMGSAVGWVDNTVAPPVGYLFTIGGNTTNNNEVQKYNEATDTWTTLASLPAGKTVLGSACVGNYIYAIAGSSGGVVSSTVFKYDIAGNSWVAVSDIPLAMRWNKAVAYGNYIYVAGGLDASDNVLSSVYIYNTLTDTWGTATSMPGPKFGGAFSITGNTLVYAAGADASVITNSVYVGTISLADPSIINWTTAKSVYPGTSTLSPITSDDLKAEIATPSSGSNPKANYPGGTMYRFDAAPWGTDGVIITTGSPSAAWTPASPNPCFVYKPATDTWIVQPNLPVAVLGAYLGSVDKNNSGTHTWRLIVASGYTGSAVSTATQILTEIFAPPTKTLNLKLYLEGFVKARGGILPAAGFMYKAQVSPDGSVTSDAFAGTVVDTLTVALANSASPYSIAYYKHFAQLNTNGTMSLSIPATYSGNYYIAIRHRQSIETWSAAPVSFSGSTINYDFSTAASQAYGSNQASLGASWGYGLYAGDIVKDGYIDLSEVNATYSSARLAQYSYLLYDFTGNGFVELDDVNLIYANYRTSKSFLWPGATK